MIKGDAQIVVNFRVVLAACQRLGISVASLWPSPLLGQQVAEFEMEARVAGVFVGELSKLALSVLAGRQPLNRYLDKWLGWLPGRRASRCGKQGEGESQEGFRIHVKVRCGGKKTGGCEREE